LTERNEASGSSVLTYVYCLVLGVRRPSLGAAPHGVPGDAGLRLLDLGGELRAIVGSVPGREYGETALSRGLHDLDWVSRRAMSHEAVVEHFLSARAVLPMQLFTLFTSDDRAVDHFTRDRAGIDAILARLERRLEWGLRLTFDETAVPRRPGGPTPPASGAAYLERKRDLRDESRRQMARARIEAERLFRAMAREASETRRHTATERAAPGSRLLLDAAFLVPVRRAAAFRASLRRNARTLGGRGVVVSLTGPWPPYNFIAAPRASDVRRTPLGRRRAGAARKAR
jgi:hypothetical protein